MIMNTWFQHHQRHLYTWKSPGDCVRNQIDYITINRRFLHSIYQVKGYPGADCGSDHVPMKLHRDSMASSPDKGTGNAIFVLRMLVESSIEKQKDVHACFIDYSKAFDTVKPMWWTYYNHWMWIRQNSGCESVFTEIKQMQ